MVMTEKQILDDYRGAKDQKEQVKILAELNAVDVWTMATWLKEHGAGINLQNFQKWNPKWKASAEKSPITPRTAYAAAQEAEPPEGQADPAAAAEAQRPTTAMYQKAIREAERLRERNDELSKELYTAKVELAEERSRAKATGARTPLTDAQKVHIVEIVLNRIFLSCCEDPGDYIDVLDAIINEKEDRNE